MKTMIRTSLVAIAFAALATVASVNSAAAQAGAPVRTLSPNDRVVATTVAEQKAAPCADRNCATKPVKRAYAGAAPLGW
jgi:hypothetical protein